MSTTNKVSFNQLQFLRFIAFFGVFRAHAFEFYPEWDSRLSFHYWTEASVSFFILLSGFLYGLKYYDDNDDFSFKKICKFVISFIKKVWPLHLIMAIIYLRENTIWYDITTLNIDSFIVNVKAILLNTFLLQGWSLEHRFSLNGVSWFLCAMMFLRIITLPAIKLFKKIFFSKYGKAKSILIYIGLMILSFLYCSRCMKLDLNTEYYCYTLPTSRIYEYLCGLIIGLFVADMKSNNNKIIGTILELSSFALYIFLIKNLRSFGIVDYYTRSLIWIVPGSIILTVFARANGYLGDLFKLTPFKILGDLSFEAFLIHYFFIFIFAIDANSLNNFSKTIAIIYLLVETFFASFVIHYALDLKNLRAYFLKLIGKE